MADHAFGMIVAFAHYLLEMWEGRRDILKENRRRFLSNKPFLYVSDMEAGF